MRVLYPSSNKASTELQVGAAARRRQRVVHAGDGHAALPRPPARPPARTHARTNRVRPALCLPLQTRLSERGFLVERLNTYDTVPVSRLDGAALEAARCAAVVTVGSPSAIRHAGVAMPRGSQRRGIARGPPPPAWAWRLAGPRGVLPRGCGGQGRARRRPLPPGSCCALRARARARPPAAPLPSLAPRPRAGRGCSWWAPRPRSAWPSPASAPPRRAPRSSWACRTSRWAGQVVSCAPPV